MEVSKYKLAQNRLDKLIAPLRTAVDNDGTLDKEATSYNDIIDAFRLALKSYHFTESEFNLIFASYLELMRTDRESDVIFTKELSRI